MFLREAVKSPFQMPLAGVLPRYAVNHNCDGKEISWCLWCLFRPEIRAIYAEELKQLQQARS